MKAIGELSLWAALGLTAWGTGAGWGALRAAGTRRGALVESAVRGTWAAAALLAAALAGIVSLLLDADTTYTFAALTTSERLPSAFRLAALWSRGAGSWLVLTLTIAVLAAFALLAARRSAGAQLPALATALNAMLCAILVVLVTAAYPYARTATVPSEGMGLAPEWQTLWAPVTRAAIVLAAGAFAVALAHAVARLAPWRWWLAAWSLGTVALALAARRAQGGDYWRAADWVTLAAWLALAALLHRRVGSTRLASRVAHGGAACALVGLAGLALRADHRVSLASGTSVVLGDPFGASWTFTSEGVSKYDELNRHVTAALVEVRRGRGRTRVVRAEWRQYLDSREEPLGEAPVSVVLTGPLMGVVVALGAWPEGDDATLVVRFTPLIIWLWIGAAAMALGGAIATWREP